ncbi:MAG TPA: type II secretion system protein GspE, partial [Alteromonas sp.]|nr:type II secretion system protein GspE [Alteromonas sp.]
MSTEAKQPELTESVASVAAESAEELLPEEAVDDQQLPFGFAKRHKVLLELNQAPALLYHTSETPLEIFSEVRRYHAGALVLKELPQDQFEPLLTQAYQRDSSAAKQLMEDLGNESDLFSLAEELPDTEDLLDSEDDAPIIKLINAMLGEAIKEGASDIHIETFENQ